jgi:hypothetical protein
MNVMQKEILDLIFLKKKFEEAEYSDYTDTEGQERDLCVDFIDACGEAAQSKNMDVLLQLIDFFDDTVDLKYGGVLESLESIVRSFYSDQILEAFYKKFDSFMKKNLLRCIHISWSLMCENFEKFRKMFNTVKSKHSNNFLDQLYEFTPEGKKEISILRDDMKKW